MVRFAFGGIRLVAGRRSPGGGVECGRHAFLRAARGAITDGTDRGRTPRNPKTESDWFSTPKMVVFFLQVTRNILNIIDR